jgi:sugar phosphate isomerase/epimerase
MKVSCLPVSFFPDILNGSMTIKGWARIANECGLDAIDLSIIFIKNHTIRYLSQIKKDIENEDMSITMITTYPDFSHPDDLQVEREMEYLRNDIAVASFLEAKFLRILAGQNYPGIDKESSISKVIDCFKRISSVADKYKVKLVYENHSKPGVWDYTDFSHPTEIFLKIAEGIKDTGIGINFDTANTTILGDDSLEVLKKIIGRVSVIHAADTLGVGELKPALIGKGIVPFREIFKYLKKVKFDEWICIEEASNTGIEGLKKAIDFIKKTWNES